MAVIAAFQDNPPYPIYEVPYTVIFPMLDADGDPVTGETCDSERSIDGDTGVDCTNEGTEITFTTATNKGMYYLTLTAAELTSVVTIITVYAANSKATPIVLYPKVLPPIADSTATAGAAGTITLAVGSSAVDDYYNGCYIYLNGGTGSGQGRMITNYVGSTRVATIAPNWGTNPDDTSEYIIYSTEESWLTSGNVAAISGSATAADNLEAVLLGTGDTADVDLVARSLKLNNDADVALEILSSDDSAIKAVSSAAGKHGMELAATAANGDGLNAIGNTTGDGFHLEGGATGHGISTQGGATSGQGIFAAGAVDGSGILARGGSSSGAGFKAEAKANNDAGMELVKHGTGKDIDADEVDTIDTVVDGIQTDLSNATDGLGALKDLIDTLNDTSVADIIAGVADGSYDLQEMMRIIFAACALKSSGGGTTEVKFRDSADGTDRITATVDSDGNRTAITLDGS